MAEILAKVALGNTLLCYEFSERKHKIALLRKRDEKIMTKEKPEFFSNHFGKVLITSTTSSTLSTKCYLQNRAGCKLEGLKYYTSAF